MAKTKYKRAINVALRMFYDVIVINLAMLASIYLHYLRFLFVQHESFSFTFDTYFQWTTRELALWEKYALPYTVAALVIFLIFGFYNTSRFRRFRDRLAFIVIGTVFANTTVLLMMYFNIETERFPRGITLLFLLFSLLFNAMPRLIKPLLVWAQAQLTLPKQNSHLVSHVLVIGGAGYIGSVLSKHLLDKGFYVTALDQIFFGEEPIKDLLQHRNFKFVKGDCRNLSEILPALENVDAVVHLAGLVGDPACSVSEDLTIDINYASTQMLRDLCRARNINRFIFASTCSVYGVSEEVLDEDSNLNPVSLYARTKIDSENVLLKSAEGGFCPTILRFATVFGLSARPRFDLVVNTFVGHALTKNKIEVHGGNQWRPFVHTTDIARAIEMVLLAPPESVSRQVFNVGDDRLNLTIRDLAKKVQGIVPQVEVINHGDSPDPRNYRVSFNKIKKTLGFECLVDIEAGIRELYAAFLNADLDLSSSFYNNFHQLKFMIATQDEATKNRIYKAEILKDGWIKSELPELEKERLRA